MRLISPRAAAIVLLIGIAAGVAQAQKIKVEFDKNIRLCEAQDLRLGPDSASLCQACSGGGHKRGNQRGVGKARPEASE